MVGAQIMGVGEERQEATLAGGVEASAHTAVGGRALASGNTEDWRLWGGAGAALHAGPRSPEGPVPPSWSTSGRPSVPEASWLFALR